MTQKPDKERDPTEPLGPRRPILLTIMFWVFVLWTLLGWLRFMRALAGRSQIMTMLPSGLYWYLLFAGLLCGIAGLPALWGLVRGARWTVKPLVIAAFFYPALYWFERLFLWRDPYAQRNWPFMLTLTLFWCGLVVWAMRSKNVKHFFHDN